MMRALAYIFAGIPAAIGIAFVARFAFTTSDSAVDGVATAFLYAMVAAGAFIGPAIVVAVAANGRRAAAAVLGLLTFLAILTNWTHTLGAIAHRGAGTEAEAAKARATVADDRAALAAILEKSRALPAFAPATDDDVTAARAAVKAAEDSRKAECENRGKHCRARETAEQEKRAALATTLANKALTDKARTLDSDSAVLRKRLASAPAVKETNPLGEALARLMPWLPAASAATIQQAVVSAIAELLIAAGLALPELLRRDARQAARIETLGASGASGVSQAPPDQEAIPEPPTAFPLRCSVQPSIAGVPMKPAPKPDRVGGVGEFMLACLPRAKGNQVTLTGVYARYQRWCEEQSPAVAPEDAGAFAEQFRALAERVRLRTEKRGGKVYVADVRLVA